jgi:hypothetical protein
VPGIRAVLRHPPSRSTASIPPPSASPSPLGAGSIATPPWPRSQCWPSDARRNPHRGAAGQASPRPEGVAAKAAGPATVAPHRRVSISEVKTTPDRAVVFAGRTRTKTNLPAAINSGAPANRLVPPPAPRVAGGLRDPPRRLPCPPW